MRLREGNLRKILADIFGEHFPIMGNQFRISCINPDCRDKKGNLEIDMKRGIFHCFSSGTEIITYDGIKKIENLSGKFTKILTEGGKWVNVKIHNFGRQKLKKIVLKKDRKEKIIYATEGHRWFVRKIRYQRQSRENLKEVLTNELKPGHKLAYNVPIKPKLDFKSIDTNYWIARGFVFGDGVKPNHRGKTTAYFHRGKDEYLLPYFYKFLNGKKPYRNKIRYIIGSLPGDFKILPFGAKNEEMYCWLKGYFAADGSVHKNSGESGLSSSKKENLEFIQDICLRLGIGTCPIGGGIRKSPSFKTGSSLYGIYFNAPDLDEDFFILPRHRKYFAYGRSRPKNFSYRRISWTVKSVESTDRIEDVYCAVVPKTHSFTLANYILTGNCWICNYSGTIYRLLKDYLGWVPKIEKYSTADDLRQARDIDSLIQADEVHSIAKKVIDYSVLPKEYVYLGQPPESLSMLGKKALKYVLSRMSREDVVQHKVGYCGLGKYKWRLIIPFFDGDRAIYFVARTFMGGSRPYDNPKKDEIGVGKEEIVFNIDMARKLGQAVICEGVFDAIRVGLDGTAILGVSISSSQFVKFLHMKKIYVMLDSDAQNHAAEMARKFKNAGKEVYLINPVRGDPDDYSREEIRTMMTSAKPFDILDGILN